MQDEEMLQPRRRTAQEKLLGFLKARYCAAKALIYRSFIYRILHAEDPDSISDDDRRGAELSLRAAIAGPVYAGILWDNLKTIEKPINPCRRCAQIFPHVSLFPSSSLPRLVRESQ
jgi:hypothetical protein